jgi:hypothetical protein
MINLCIHKALYIYVFEKNLRMKGKGKTHIQLCYFSSNVINIFAALVKLTSFSRHLNFNPRLRPLLVDCNSSLVHLLYPRRPIVNPDGFQAWGIHMLYLHFGEIYSHLENSL